MLVVLLLVRGTEGVLKTIPSWREIMAEVLGDETPETLAGIPLSDTSIAKLRAEIGSLTAQLERIEKRLGTSNEQAEDVSNARTLAHGLRNKLTTVWAVPREQRARFVGISTAA
jgi:hypothetical protein